MEAMGPRILAFIGFLAVAFTVAKLVGTALVAFRRK